MAEKTLCVALNDISCRNEVRASRYLILKNNKITVSRRRTTRQTNLENFVPRERLVEINGCQHYVYQANECALHGTYVRATGTELYRNDFATTASSCMRSEYLKPTLLLTYS